MNKSAKEIKYDNKTAEYRFVKSSTEKPASIATGHDQVNKNEDLIIMVDKIENTKRDS